MLGMTSGKKTSGNMVVKLSSECCNNSTHATWYGLSNTDFGLFRDDTAVSCCDTDLRQITEKQFMSRGLCVAKQNSFIVDTTSFFR